MFYLAPYRQPLAPKQRELRLRWLGLVHKSNKDIGSILVEDRLMYHYCAYLLLCEVITHEELNQYLNNNPATPQLFNWLKANVQQSIKKTQLKQLALNAQEAWRVALLHNITYALEQTAIIDNDLPFEYENLKEHQLRLVHAQPSMTLWGNSDDQQIWLEEVANTLKEWPSDTIEEEHPSNGIPELLGRKAEIPYTYLSLKAVLEDIYTLLKQPTIEQQKHFLSLYNQVVRLCGAYAARPLANAALFPPQALWDTIQQHRIFPLRAHYWLKESMYILPCTRLLLQKHYTQSDVAPYLWTQHDRKRYLEAMQRSIDTLLHY